MEAKVYLKRYRLCLDQIGLPVVIRRSATEATFRAEDMRTGREVAAQIVPLKALRSLAREEVEEEAKAARAIDQINIPALQDFGFDNGQVVYVTEYFDGTTAANWVRTHGPMPVGAVLRIALQVVNASSLATFHGIVHHAINPSNIMLVPGQTNEGEWPLIKVLNFVGVAPSLTPPASIEPGTIVPAQFASPEQIQTGEVDFRSQMYSLGATLFFLLTGMPPAHGALDVDDANHLPSVVKDLLARMLARDPDERPLDPLALQAQIEDCLAQLDRRDAVASKLGLPLASEAVVSMKRPRRSRPWIPIALAALLLGLASLAAVWMSAHLRKDEAIGVPIGVPESTPAIAQVPAPAATPEDVVITPPGAEPPVVESSEVAKNEEPASSPPASGESTQSPVVEISPPMASETEEEPVRVATADSTPPPDARDASSKPNEETEAQGEKEENEAVVKLATPAAVAAPTPEEPRKAEVISKPREELREPIKPTERTKTPASTAWPAQENSPPPVRGSGRAQFLGTTPDGNLIFGLPSSEKVYVAPPAKKEREEKPRARPRRSPPEQIDGLPVLPALPPDPE